jgi:hypothetical protein
MCLRWQHISIFISLYLFFTTKTYRLLTSTRQHQNNHAIYDYLGEKKTVNHAHGKKYHRQSPKHGSQSRTHGKKITLQPQTPHGTRMETQKECNHPQITSCK